MKSILVSGGTGFVGNSLCPRLFDGGWSVCVAMRGSRDKHTLVSGCEGVTVGGIGADTDWRPFLKDIDSVVHLAARVHVMRNPATDPLADFRWVNVDGTFNLAKQAADAGVRRFVFVSSIKVNGEETVVGRPFTENDQSAPQDAYAISKWEAEQNLLKLASETEMEVVIIRPPLVYGPGVKANFFTMMRWLAHGIPLPLGAIHNRRSLVALDNLIDLLVTCIDHPAAANQVFLVSDGEDMSTSELLRRTAAALGKPARLLPVPQAILTLGLKLLRKDAFAQRLCGSLQVDITKARTLLGWNPPVGVDAALMKTAHHFLEHQWS